MSESLLVEAAGATNRDDRSLFGADRRIPTLDGWRAVAITLVVFYHLLTGVFPKGSLTAFLVQQGERGVDIFFALSGLLITSRLLDQQQTTGRLNLPSFYVRRAIRILPPYFLYLAVLGILAILGVVSVYPGEWVGCALFFRNYLPQPAVNGWFTAHFWSLSVEEHFYLFWPVILLLAGSRRGAAAGAGLALGVAVWRRIDQHYLIISPFGMGRTDLRVDGILWGATAAILIREPHVQAWLARWLKAPLWTALLVFALLLALATPPMGTTVLNFMTPWLLVGTALRPTLSASRLLESAPLRWVGRISYGLYLWQQLWVSGAVWKHLGVSALPGAGGLIVHSALAIAASVAAAAASYYAVERPLQRRRPTAVMNG